MALQEAAVLAHFDQPAEACSRAQRDCESATLSSSELNDTPVRCPEPVEEPSICLIVTPLTAGYGCRERSIYFTWAAGGYRASVMHPQESFSEGSDRERKCM